MDAAPTWDRPAFAVDGRQFTISEVLRALHFRDEFSAAWQAVCRLDAHADFEVDADAVQAGSEQFRTDRDLITAEETEAWLEKRGLTLDEFSDYFFRHQAMAMLASEPALPETPDYADAPEELRDLLRVDLLVGGDFDRLSEKLAWRFLTRPSNDSNPPADWQEELTTLETTFQEQSAQLLTPRALEDALVTLRLSLTRVEVEVLEVESHDAANEALLCLHEDGESMEEVARDGAYPLRQRELAVEHLAGDVQARLMSASPGEVLGPFVNGDEFQIYRLVRKVEPDPARADIQAALERYITERHFSELAAKRVKWIIAPASLYAQGS